MTRKEILEKEKELGAAGRARVVASGQYIRLLRKGSWEFMERSNCTGVVIIVPVTDEGKLVFLEQFRVPVSAPVIEFPAGLVNDRRGARKESGRTAARRELLEETGYRARRLVEVTSGPSAAGSSTVMITMFLAFGLTRAGAGGGDETEFIKSFEVSPSRAHGWLEKKKKEGCLVDPKIYTGLYFYSQYNRNLKGK